MPERATPAAETPGPRSAPWLRRRSQRTPSGQPASSALKMSCPFCGCSESAVVRSRSATARSRVHRRRECAGCGQRFPTSERVDRELLHYELEQRGAAPPIEAFAGPPSSTLANLEALILQIRADAMDGEFVASDFNAALHILCELRGGAL